MLVRDVAVFKSPHTILRRPSDYAFLPGSEYSHVFEGPAVLLLLEAIKHPRTRSADARQVSNAHERDLVTFQKVRLA